MPLGVNGDLYYTPYSGAGVKVHEFYWSAEILSGEGDVPCLSDATSSYAPGGGWRGSSQKTGPAKARCGNMIVMAAGTT